MDLQVLMKLVLYRCQRDSYVMSINIVLFDNVCRRSTNLHHCRTETNSERCKIEEIGGVSRVTQ